MSLLRALPFLTDPWSWWVEPFLDNEFMQRALLGGVLAALCTSVVGTWVVLRGMTFLGDALAHGVLPGVAVAFIAGGDTTLGALVAAAVMVVGIDAVRAASPLPQDTAIGLLFVGMLALTVVILSSEAVTYTGDLTRFLFGSVTGIDSGDLWRQAVAAVISVGGSVVLYRPLLVLTFDADQARLLGMRPRLTHNVLLALVAVSVVASFETVGSLLVFAFLIAPPATAALLVRGVPAMMASAAALGAASALVGILVSYHYGSAAGGTMALTAVAVFFLVLTATAAARGASSVRARARP